MNRRANAKTDPFAADPEEAPSEDETPAKKEKNVTNAEGKIVITHKGGSGYDAPWIVLHLGDEQEAAEFYGADANLPKDELLKELMERVQSASSFFTSKSPEKPSRPSGRAPQAASEHPDGKTEKCTHGDMIFKSGTIRNGKRAGEVYRAFDCPKDICKRRWDD